MLAAFDSTSNWAEKNTSLLIDWLIVWCIQENIIRTKTNFESSKRANLTWIHDNEPFGTLILTAHFKIMCTIFYPIRRCIIYSGDCRQPPANLARLSLYHFRSFEMPCIDEWKCKICISFNHFTINNPKRDLLRLRLHLFMFYFDQFKFKWVQQIDDAFHFIHSTATQQLHVSTQSLSVYRSLPMQPHTFWKLLFFYSCISTNSQHSQEHKPHIGPHSSHLIIVAYVLLCLFFSYSF